MSGQAIGEAPCPYCRRQAGATLMRTGRVCLTCNHCKLQVFARGDLSDELIRNGIKRAAEPEPEPTGKAPAPAPAPAAAPAPAPARSWGLGSW